MRKLLLTAALTLVIIGAASACVPVPGRLMAAGDSVTVQASYFGSSYLSTADRKDTIGIGWKASTANPGITRAVNDPKRSPATLVIAFGLNDRDGNVWSTPERNAMFSDVFAPDRRACVVLVKPWALDNATHTGPRYPQAMAAIRDGLDRLAAARPHTMIADWREAVTADPTLLGPDYVHLNDITAESKLRAANAYGNMMATAAKGC